MVANRIDDSGGGLYMTVEQYLALDDATDGKYEYLDGYVFMLRLPSSAYDDQALVDMAGGSIAHAALCARLAMLLGNALDESPCLVYSSDASLLFCLVVMGNLVSAQIHRLTEQLAEVDSAQSPFVFTSLFPHLVTRNQNTSLIITRLAV